MAQRKSGGFRRKVKRDFERRQAALLQHVPDISSYLLKTTENVDANNNILRTVEAASGSGDGEQQANANVASSSRSTALEEEDSDYRVDDRQQDEETAGDSMLDYLLPPMLPPVS